jgi:hypothetical protein
MNTQKMHTCIYIYILHVYAFLYEMPDNKLKDSSRFIYIINF